MAAARGEDVPMGLPVVRGSTLNRLAGTTASTPPSSSKAADRPPPAPPPPLVPQAVATEREGWRDLARAYEMAQTRLLTEGMGMGAAQAGA